MKIEEYIESILERPHIDNSSLNATVTAVLNDVRTRGDEAVREYEKKFDGVDLQALQATEEEFVEAETLLSTELKESLRIAHENIYRFHLAQDQPLPRVETISGVTCWQKSVPIERVGLYIPGGTAPLFSTVLMLATPAVIAGCKEIVLCTPPNKEGKIHPAILYSAKVAGVRRVFKIGGVQAIGAMAYGTESVPKVYKIFGPGNQYVTCAKQLVSLRDVAIDMPAGPSEVEVIADQTANPIFVASDFLSQAEHGADSQSLLLTTSHEIAEKTIAEIDRQKKDLPRRELIEKSLSHSHIVVVESMEKIVEITNDYAPEHLIIQTQNPRDVAEKITNAGSVFIGSLTPESAGDYASGTNHTLPTSGFAKAYSGVNLDSFRRKMTFQEITPDGVKNIGNVVATMAENEELFAHRNAMLYRLKSV